MRFAFAFAALFLPVFAQETPKQTRTEPALGEFRWREIGPCNMGGRINDVAVVESRPQIFYIGVATGGVWKTVNNGTTWTPLFDQQGTASIGDIDVCQSNPDLVWVGTGEANARNSVTHGDGVYKSTDGGKTWKNMGLRDTRFIGRVVIHPRDPNTVYVAALGNIYVPSRDRGLYKTVDGGATWTCVKYLDENTGFIDVALDPSDPDVILAAAYEVRRDAFSSSATPSRYGPAAGIYKSDDAGRTWRRIAEGLPKNGLGRIGFDYYRKDPRIVYAIVETSKTPDMAGGGGGGGGGSGGAYMGIQAEEQESGLILTEIVEGGPADKSGFQAGDTILEFGTKKITSYQELITELRARKPGDKVMVKILRGGEEKTIELTLGKRPDEAYRKEISFQDSLERGGVFRSEDGGETWAQMSTLNPRPFYFSQIRVDPTNDQRIFVLGVQLHLSTNGGKNWNNNAGRGVHSDHHAMWINPQNPEHVIDGTDGGLYASYDGSKSWEHLSNLPLGQFYAVGLDMKKPYNVYGGLQDNGCWGGPSRTRDPFIGNEHWRFLNGGDGFYCRVDPTDPDTLYCESQYGMPVRADLRTGARKSIRPKGSGLRFEWNTPIELSPHDPKRIYIGAQKLFESPDRGDNFKEISGDVTKSKLGTISVIGLSPVDENEIWVGTTDGAVAVTRDRGQTWTDLKIPGLPELLWITRVECSASAVYVTAEGRRKADYKPYAFKTTNGGKTWTSITDGIPQDESVYVIRQDRKNADLLFLGTERTVYASLNGGRGWVKLGGNLPVVPVHDLAIHPRDGELVAATHGRSFWIVDIRPLQELKLKTLFTKSHLFEIREEPLWNPGKDGWFGGAKAFRGANPAAGAGIWYYLGKDAKSVSLVITDTAGQRVVGLATKNTKGLHRVQWNLLRGRSRAAAGEYTVTLTVDGETRVQKLRVVPDPEDVAAERKTSP